MGSNEIWRNLVDWSDNWKIFGRRKKLNRWQSKEPCGARSCEECRQLIFFPRNGVQMEVCTVYRQLTVCVNICTYIYLPRNGVQMEECRQCTVGRYKSAKGESVCDICPPHSTAVHTGSLYCRFVYSIIIVFIIQTCSVIEDYHT